MKKNFLNNFKNGISHGIGFLSIILIGGIVYATVYNWSNLPATVGEGLNIAKWNKLVEYSVPPGAVMAFNGDNCPTGWVLADGTGDEPKTDGTMSTLDLRGEFIRGLDKGRLVDNGRVLGSSQNGTLISDKTVQVYINGTNQGEIGTKIEQYDGSVSSGPAQRQTTTGISTSQPYTKYYIRPRNVALLYCIKTNQ